MAAATHKSYRFLDLGSAMAVHDHQPAFELHESDIYDSSSWPSPEQQRRRKPVVKLAEDPSVPRDGIAKKVTSSLPVNIPDWLRIPREEDMGRDEYSYDEGEDESCERLPPHEFLARTRAASVSLSGRSLKGRDLSRVRNAIWAKIGFLD